MITIAPKTDLITRLNPKFVSQLLRDHHLPLGSNTVSHTAKYNRLVEWNGDASRFSGERLRPTGPRCSNPRHPSRSSTLAATPSTESSPTHDPGRAPPRSVIAPHLPRPETELGRFGQVIPVRVESTESGCSLPSVAVVVCLLRSKVSGGYLRLL